MSTPTIHPDQAKTIPSLFRIRLAASPDKIAYQSSICGEFSQQDQFLSFIPLSNMLERTGGYYLPMMVGAEMAFARSVNLIAADLKAQRPGALRHRRWRCNACGNRPHLK